MATDHIKMAHAVLSGDLDPDQLDAADFEDCCDCDSCGLCD